MGLHQLWLFSLLQGCVTNVEKWLLENCGVILGICAGVAVIEVRPSLRLALSTSVFDRLVSHPADKCSTDVLLRLLSKPLPVGTKGFVLGSVVCKT